MRVGAPLVGLLVLISPHLLLGQTSDTTARTSSPDSGRGSGVPISRPSMRWEKERPPQLKKVGTWYFPLGEQDGDARVVMQAVVDTNGNIEPDSIKVISTTDSLFALSAIATLRSATFRPGMVGHHPVRVLIRVPLHFNQADKPRCIVGLVNPDGSRRCQ